MAEPALSFIPCHSVMMVESEQRERREDYAEEELSRGFSPNLFRTYALSRPDHAGRRHVARFFEASLNRVTEACAMPARIRPRRIDTYFYSAQFNVASSPAALPVTSARAQEQVGIVMAQLGEI
jgi:hypothetical protein